MSKTPKCRRCRMTAPDPEHLYERGDGKWFCQTCIVILMADADIAEANRAIDALLTRHSSHVQPALDCVFCAYGVV